MNQPTRTTSRRLPRSNAPRAGESLTGYLINLAYRLSIRPKDLIVRTGLKDSANPSLLDLQYTVAIPDRERERFAETTGLTEEEVHDLTTGRHLNLLNDDSHPIARTLHSNLWVDLGHTRYCPTCLADTDPATPAHAVWQVNWLTPWALACTTHQRLLLDACLNCQQRVGTSGPHAFRSAIPHLHLPVTHPAACRASHPHNPNRMCDTRLDHTEAPQAHPDLLRLQTELDAALTSTGEPAFTSLGTPVSAAHRLRDLRLVSVLLQPTPQDHRAEPVTLPPRVLTQPPTTAVTAAHLLLSAAQLLDDPAHWDQLQARSRHALRHHKSAWKKAVATGGASPALNHALKDPKNGIVDPHKLRAYTAANPRNLTAKHIPAYLPEATYRRHFPDIPDRYQRPIRRCVPIAIVRLLTNTDTTSAGQLLGYDETATQAACARASDAFDSLGTNVLRQRIARIVAEHANDPMHVDYQRLRTHFTSEWTIPEDLWAALQAALLRDKMARADTPWERRRPAYDAWVWALITNGDINTAPMIRTAVNGRQCTNGVAKDISDLQRRTPPAHHRLVHVLAQDVKKRIPG